MLSGNPEAKKRGRSDSSFATSDEVPIFAGQLDLGPIAAKPAPVCPVDNTISACVVTPEDCFSDAECQQGQLCCPRGCSRRCTAPTFRQPDPRSRCSRGSCPRGIPCVIYETNCNRGITGLRLCPLATVCVPDFRDQCQVIRCTSETQCRYRPNPSCARPSRSCPPIAGCFPRIPQI
ncbi:unnamed protein product [Notodromas monacha]|uniref:WAP domain-containing protein n=1 Tax=Notodromas monacha TaxID=399045 RepID=A0A7R9BVJ1_9CRUS|nr:unnamed protein product [Notodromas monacha]CAG0922526.1 unnamed protein product [Notodromas monacha]